MSKQDEYMLVDGTGMTVAAFGAMPMAGVKRIYATGCTSLVNLHAPNAVYIYPTGCTALAGAIHGGMDSRGYHFFGLPQSGKYRIFAGCRNFTPEEALAHWGPGGPSDRPDCLALVQKIIAEIKMKEQA